MKGALPSSTQAGCDAPTAPRIVVARISRVLQRVPADVAWMSDSERARYEGFGSGRRRDEYRAGHWLLRELLSGVEGAPVATLSLDDRVGAPPGWSNARPSATTLALSHSQSWVAAACGHGRFGLDVEQRPRVMAEHIRGMLCQEDDESEPDDDRLLERWAIKEAWIKADCGSALPETIRALSVHRAGDGQANAWTRSSRDFHLALVAEASVAPRFVVEDGAESATDETWRAWRVTPRGTSPA